MRHATVAAAAVALITTAAAAGAARPPAPPGPAPAPSPEAAPARTLFALILRPGAAWRPGRPFAEQGLRPHFDYWMALFRAGRVVSAGPLGDDGGLVLLRARDRAEADAVMRADPAVAARIFAADMRPYAPPMIRPELLAPPR